MNYGIKIGGVHPAGDRDADEHTHVGNAAAERRGIGFVLPHIRGISEVCGYLLYFFKPCVGIVCIVERIGKCDERRLHIRTVKALGYRVLAREQLVVEKAHERLDLAPEAVVLARLLSAASYGKYRLCIGGVTVEQREEIGIVYLCPARKLSVNIVGAHAGYDVFGYILDLCAVKKAARCAHLLYIKFEIGKGFVGVLHPPLLKVGVENGKQIFGHRSGGIAVALVVVHIRAEIAL